MADGEFPRDRKSATRPWRPRTRAVRAGLARSQNRETAEALYLTSGFVYDSAEEAENAFGSKRETRYVYARYGNPTVSVFEERLRQLEGAEACCGTASGMAAVFASLMCQLRAGDRVVASRALFGSCHYIVSELLPRFGMESQFVDGADIAQWEAALSRPAKVVLLETPSNPMLDIVDLQRVAELAHAAGARVVVDNVFATPLLQKPLEFGADIVVYSATKHIDGQGRTLGGAVLGTSEFIETDLKPFYKHTGPSLSPFNAWVLAKGLETMELRLRAQCESAERIARFLEQHPAVAYVRYPTLDSHPQKALAMQQMSAGGTMVTFSLKGGKAAAFRCLNALGVIDISNNLGDAKSLACHPATTTHQRLGAEERAKLGIDDGVIRLSVGLEDAADLEEDLEQALARR
jgi:O-succinylhomoserine sulfhydrylase